MKKTAVAISLALLVLSAAPAGTQTVPPDKPGLVSEERLVAGPTLQDLLAYAYDHSPMVRAGREGWRGALARVKVEGSHADPQLSLVYWPSSVTSDFSVRRFEVMLSESLPFPGKLAAATKVAQSEADFGRLELDRTVRDLVVGVRESYHELLYIREARRIATANTGLLDSLSKIGAAAASENRATYIDIAKAQSQVAQSAYDALLLAELERTEAARMNALLDRPSEAPLGPLPPWPVVPLAYSLEEISRLAEGQREEIRLAGTEIEKSEAEVAMARLEGLPEFMVGLQYEYDAPMGAPTEKMLGLQVGMTIPLWVGKNRARSAASQAGVEKARAMRQAQVNETRAMVREAWFRLHNAERLAVLYRDQLIPQAAKAMETADAWYRQGQGSFSDFVETQAVWYNFQLARARAEADHGKYLARLEALAGRDLTAKAAVEAPPTGGERK